MCHLISFHPVCSVLDDYLTCLHDGGDPGRDELAVHVLVGVGRGEDLVEAEPLASPGVLVDLFNGEREINLLTHKKLGQMLTGLKSVTDQIHEIQTGSQLLLMSFVQI